MSTQAQTHERVRKVRLQHEAYESDAMCALIQHHARVELVVSTCHMRWATDRVLADPQSELQKAVAVLEYGSAGWLFPVSDEQVSACRQEGFDDLAEVLTFAQAAGASQLIFDEGAAQLPEQFGIPEYDWDAESARPTEGAGA